MPRRKRYLPMLAGMLTDVLAIAGLTLAAAALHPAAAGGTGAGTGAAAFGYRFLLSMAFAVVLRFAWQFLFFLRTDLYYLTTTAAGLQRPAGHRPADAVEPHLAAHRPPGPGER